VEKVNCSPRRHVVVARSGCDDEGLLIGLLRGFELAEPALHVPHAKPGLCQYRRIVEALCRLDALLGASQAVGKTASQVEGPALGQRPAQALHLCGQRLVVRRLDLGPQPSRITAGAERR
jgi:hypothetical protein